MDANALAAPSVFSFPLRIYVLKCGIVFRVRYLGQNAFYFVQRVI